MGRIQEFKSPSVMQLREHHVSMASAFVIGGLQPTELANAFGFSKGQISRILQTPAFRVEVQRLRKLRDRALLEAQRELIEGAREAVNVLIEDTKMDPQRDPGLLRIRQAAANSLLDRVGLGAKGEGSNIIQHQQNINTNVNFSNLSDQQLLSFVLKGLEDHFDESDRG